MRELSDTQMSQRPGMIELGLGHPDPTLIDADGLRAAAGRAFELFGREVINYGFNRGPGPLRDWLRARLQRIDAPAAPIEPDAIMISGGFSYAFDQLATLLLKPGDVVFAQAPTYHLALRILRDHGVSLRAIPSDADGPRADALAAAIEVCRAEGRRPAMLYAIPTFNNPTGACWSASRRAEVLEIADAAGVLIAEDDVYRELGFDAPAPPSLWSIARLGAVVRLGSFSKSLAAGLRVGWVTADAALIKRLELNGVTDSGGGPNQFAAMIAAAYCMNGDAYDAQLTHLRAAYRARRDALIGAVRAHLPGCAVETPAGGLFAWITLPLGGDGEALRARSEALGVSFLTGARFFADGQGGADAIRLCFALYQPEILTDAVRQIATALRS
jgi:2-aminoadipate transaminase